MTARPMGSIINAVAVLEIHIERKAVASMKPSTIRVGLVPTTRTTWRAILRCSPQRWIPSAKMNPNVVHYSVGGHNWGSSAGDIVIIAEYANWNAIDADCAACIEWFEKRQPAEGTPERTAWDEAQAAFFKHYFGHSDEIYAVLDSRSK